jgi:4-hydroxyphenylpyruvate dioxygenase
MVITQDETNLEDPGSLHLKGIDYIELYVGNAYQATYFYRTAFGLTPIAYSGLETGESRHISFVLQHENVRLVITSTLGPDGPIADHVSLHGDGVKDIAFLVDDATLAFEEAVRRGAEPVMDPTIFEDKGEKIVKATISAFNDTVHSFIQRNSYHGALLPQYRAIKSPLRAPRAPVTGLAGIDHIAISVDQGKLDKWVEFYIRVFGFRQSHQEDVATEYSAMNSKVVQDGNGCIRFPIVEPAKGSRRSQVEEYLSFYRGAGVQHIALSCNNIVEAVQDLSVNGIEFLPVPDTYYQMVESRVGRIDEDISALRKLNILVDRDAAGYLMQIFSKPVQGRPTMFWELIQRKGALGFGGGNIRALFEAVEREQELRGTL